MSRLLVAASLLLLGCGSGGGGATEPDPPPANGNPPPSTPSAAQVSMQSGDDGYGTITNAFSPPTVSVTRGGTVTWTNETGIVHNVTFAQATGAPANVAGHSSGENVRTFGTAGSFGYECTLHEGMTGTVTVN